MDIYQKIKIGKKSYRISFLSIITVLYFCKPSFVNFATAIGFNTRIMTFCVLLPFVVLFSCLFIKNLKNVKWDGIILYILCAILFLLTIKFHPEYSNRFNDIYNNGRFSAQSVFMLGSGIYTYYIIRMFDTDLDKIYNTFKYKFYI